MMMASTLRIMMDFMLFLQIYLFISVVTASDEKTIDQIIADASESSEEMNFHYDSSNGIVKTEMDMMFTIDVWRKFMHTNNSRSKRKAIRPLIFRWKRQEIPYIYQDYYTTKEKQEVQKAIDDWNALTCVRFRRANSQDRNTISFRNGMGCSSFIGMQFKPQDILLAKNCRVKSVILHELGHTIGFFHEQTRSDRDNYVSIIKRNVINSLYYNFKKQPTNAINLYQIPYDYRSIMHYGSYEFSANGQKTIVTKDKHYQNIIGKAKILSFNDVKLVNIMYNCSASCPKKSCPRNGYVAKDCQCYCPDLKKTVRKCSDPIGEEDSGVTEGKEICEDDQKNCPSWANNNECKLNPAYMLKNCQKSCGECKGGDEEKVTECKDMNTNCDMWAKLGECSKNPDYMLVNCKMSCKKCKTIEVLKNCIDKNTLCPVWAKAGHCQINSNYMLKNCKKSCSVCSSGQDEKNIDCSDENKHCEVWAKSGECRRNPGYMLNNCKNSCNNCGDNTKAYGAEPCTDENNNCEHWARIGECTSNKEYMLYYCKKSCKVCN